MTVADTVTTLLDDVAAKLDELGRVVPERRYVTTGEIVDDCEQLVVSSVPGLLHGMPDQPTTLITDCRMLTHIQLEIRLTKQHCTHEDLLPKNAVVPTPEALTADGVRAINDARCLLEAVYQLAPDSGWAMTATQTFAPEGGYQATSLIVGILDLTDPAGV